ncbi:MAG: single-stranded-DNA-specific exonuclease RecJ [Clostridia bacterium]
MRIVERPYAEADRQALVGAGVHPVLARLYAARRIHSAAELQYSAERLHAPALLKGAEQAAALLADALAAGKRLLIVADYDADGATACAVAVRALRAMAGNSGASVDYLVPDRFKLGYGLSRELVDLASHGTRGGKPDLLITVDNGIASVEGVARARELGIATLITDHHLPGSELPAAECIVNPNQPGCAFPSKALAGVGVMFYVVLALRAELRKRNWFANGKEPNLGALTDLVALGTVADVVPLDLNNRNLVAQGLKRLRAGGKAGLVALMRAAGRNPAQASAFDLGFVLGPRLNAAGRLADMSVGIECLVTDDEARAANIAQELDRLNRERRGIEAAMLQQAMAFVKDIPEGSAASVFFDSAWHQGVVGIVASRLKDRLHRPVVCFAPGEEGGEAVLRGSGRSIAGLHLRDCLDLVAKRSPGLIRRFGGHAMAAGLTISAHELDRFAAAFQATVDDLLPADARTRTVETDGSLQATHCTLEVARLLESEIWGQGFPQPLFCDTFDVHHQRVVGEKHLKLGLAKDGRRYEAMYFNALDHAGGGAIPPRIRAAYRLAVNEFNGLKSVQINLEHYE